MAVAVAVSAAVAVAPAPAVVASSTTAQEGAAPDEPPAELDCEPHPSPDGHEPPCNPHLAPTDWSANHRNAYAQGSSPYAGVGRTEPERIDVHHVGLTGAPIVLTFSPPYPDGGRVVWGSTVGFTGEVFKLDGETHELIDEFYPSIDGREGFIGASMSGAYNVLDRDNRLVVAREQGLDVFADDGEDHRSPIERVHAFRLPDEELCRPEEDDRFVGVTMTYDGHVVFATELGVIGVVPRDPERMRPDEVRTLSLNGDRCDDEGVETDELEAISNTIATDEDGGIYVVSSAATYRLDWDGNQLTAAWRVPYEDATDRGGRLGRGSGASPTLMGTAEEEDRFVVIYDDAEIFNLVLMWRDEIPEDWQGLDGEDRRVACKYPITFGLDAPDATFSEQSPLVRGYGTLLVNDRMGLDPLFARVPNRFGAYMQIFGGVPGNTPRGAERIDWDTESRSCRTVWALPDISIPNTIPTMSASDELVHAVGVRGGWWGLWTLDWRTGEEVSWVPSSPLLTSNSFWAASTVGPDRSVYSGTLGGVTRWRVCDGAAEECGRRLGLFEAVVGQGGLSRLPVLSAVLLLSLLVGALATVAVVTRRRHEP